jgi:hypothetical protein
MAPKYDVIASPLDSNAFSVMASVTQAIRSEGASDDEVEQYLAESLDNRENIITIAMKWVRLEM